MSTESTIKMPLESVFPVAYGSEEETGMLVTHGGFTEEPYVLASELYQHVPAELLGHRSFLTNGFKVYIGGTNETQLPTNIERATPECATPSEDVRYIRASELLITKIVENYLIHASSSGTPTQVRIQRRVVDSNGSRKASHDSFGVVDMEPALRNGNVHTLFTDHLATASFITGAGLVLSPGRSHNRLRYAQKIGGLSAVQRYGYFGSMYRVTAEDGTPRLETRCNDINISDWAAWQRIGGSALALAISQSPLRSMFDQSFRSDDAIMSRAFSFNSLRLQEDGTIHPNSYMQRAVGLQKKIAEVAMDHLPEMVDLPDEFFKLARERYEFCEDYESVLRGDATINLLADRADWAAKFSIILSHMKKQRAEGKKRRLDDIQAQARDLHYDSIELAATDGELHRAVMGDGYKLRRSGMFRKTVAEKDAQAAYKHAPKSTRAHLRARLLRQYDIFSADWQRVQIEDGGEVVTINLPDVRQTEFKPQHVETLADIKQLLP